MALSVGGGGDWRTRYGIGPAVTEVVPTGDGAFPPAADLAERLKGKGPLLVGGAVVLGLLWALLSDSSSERAAKREKGDESGGGLALVVIAVVAVVALALGGRGDVNVSQNVAQQAGSGGGGGGGGGLGDKLLGGLLGAFGL